MRFIINDMDIPLFFYIAYKNLTRLAPGSDGTTIETLNHVENDGNLTILDIGCGVGADTILLADYFENSTVEAVDLFKHYISVLNEKITENNLNNRVFAYEMSMYDLDFANEEFNIVFSHASAHIMGFKKALHEWKRLIKPDGYMICSDISWTGKPSRQSRSFWKNTYSEIDTPENKITQIRDEGYEFITHIPVSWDDAHEFYSDLESNLKLLEGDDSAVDFKNQLKKEIEVYRKNEDFSYVFYIMKLNSE